MKKYLKWKWSVHGLGLFMALGFLIGSSALVPRSVSEKFTEVLSSNSTSDLTELMSDCSNYSRMSAKMTQMNSHFSGTSRSVNFNPESARNAGYAEDEISMAAALAVYSDAIAKLNRDDALPVKSELANWFYSCATSAIGQTSNEDDADSVGTLSACTDAGHSEASCICGNTSYPQPSSSDGHNWVDVENPEQALQGLGYHRVYPPYARPGHIEYAKFVTYQSNHCGNNTFRKHAEVVDDDTYKLQDYVEFHTLGEPNPEVFSSGPWPYWTWPGYVLWWHLTY